RVDRTTLRAVRFKDERSRTPTPWEGPAIELLGARHVTRVEKKGTPAFSPVVYEDGANRGKRGIRFATALVLDFDHLSADVAEQVWRKLRARGWARSEEHTSELQSCENLVCRLLLEKKYNRVVMWTT